MTTTVNIHEAKTHLSRLLEQVADGEQVIIAKAGKPIAELRSYTKPDLVFGGLKGLIEYDDDTFDDDNAEILAMFDEDLGLDVSP